MKCGEKMLNCELLKNKRLKKNWTQKEAAQKSGIQVKRYQLIETGKLMANMIELANLSKIFEVDIAELIANNKNKASNTLKEERQKAGLTQAQLANLLGVKQPQVSMWESGSVGISEEMREKIDNILSKGSE